MGSAHIIPGVNEALLVIFSSWILHRIAYIQNEKKKTEASEKMDGSRAPYVTFGVFLTNAPSVKRRFRPLCFLLVVWMIFLTNASSVKRRLWQYLSLNRRVWPHLQKKNIFVIFGRFKKGNPRAVGIFRRILDRNVVVWFSWVLQ